ncbi:MAG: hypothetical protein JO023_16455 [Chloroflexi bacterium]|nr:hypothetical protein [Chloroflexota bacterium]
MQDTAPSSRQALFSVPWRVAPRAASGLPAFLERELLDRLPRDAPCELCNRHQPQPLSTLLIIERPNDLPVPFLICGRCRRALQELHAILASAATNG